MKIISFCHPANVTPSALICAVAKAFGMTNMQTKEAMQPEGEAWEALRLDVERESAKPDPRNTFDEPSASAFNDSITLLHTEPHAVYIVPINTDPANAYLRALLLNSIEDVELEQSVYGWDGSDLAFITKSSDSECEASA